jgi:hypothetical protein
VIRFETRRSFVGGGGSTSFLSGEKVNMLQVRRGGELSYSQGKALGLGAPALTQGRRRLACFRWGEEVISVMAKNLWAKEHQLSLRRGEGQHAPGDERRWVKEKLWEKEPQLSLREGEGQHGPGEERRWLSYSQGEA